MDDATPIAEAPRVVPRRFRRTRIAVALFFGAVAVAAVATLWARSYYVIDAVSGTRGSHFYYGGTYKGEIGVAAIEPSARQQIAWRWFTEPIDSRQSLFSEGPGYRVIRFPGVRFTSFGNGWRLAGSFWGLILLIALVSSAGCIPITGRFSLRTMLIATTLAAVVLGLGVWMAR